jgi:hypothetical protein
MDTIEEYEYKNHTFSEFYVFQLIFFMSEKLFKQNYQQNPRIRLSGCNLGVLMSVI